MQELREIDNRARCDQNGECVEKKCRVEWHPLQWGWKEKDDLWGPLPLLCDSWHQWWLLYCCFQKSVGFIFCLICQKHPVWEHGLVVWKKKCQQCSTSSASVLSFVVKFPSCSHKCPSCSDMLHHHYTCESATLLCAEGLWGDILTGLLMPLYVHLLLNKVLLYEVNWCWVELS